MTFHIYVLFKLYDGYVFNDCIKCHRQSTEDSLFPVGGTASEGDVRGKSLLSVSVRVGLRDSYQKAFVAYFAAVYLMRAQGMGFVQSVAATIMLHAVIYSIFLSECTPDFVTLSFSQKKK